MAYAEAEFPLFGQAATPVPTEGTTQTVNGPIQRLLVCQSIDSPLELQKLMDAVNAMDKKIEQQAASGVDKSSFFNLDKFKGVKEVLTTMMTTQASDAPTTPAYGYGYGGSQEYPKYFVGNMSGSGDGYNGNVFPMEMDGWYQPGRPQSSYSSQGRYSRPRPRPRQRLRPSGYRRYGARRPSMQPAKPIPPMTGRVPNKLRFSARNLDERPEHIEEAFLSLLEPLRPVIRQFLSIAREERELLDNELDDYAFLEDSDEEDTLDARHEARSTHMKAPYVDNSARYASPHN